MTSLSPALFAAVLYSVILMAMHIALQARVIGQRRSKKVGIGDGQDRDLARAIRVHGNFAENAPFLIAGLVLLALAAAPAWLVHLAGLIGVAGRGLHAYGFSRSAGSSFGRVAGMVLTFTAMTIAMLGLVYRLLG